MRCDKCGTKNEENIEICKKCGKKLKKEVEKKDKKRISFRNTFKSPYQTTKDNCLKENFTYSFAVFGINTLLLGLFVNLYMTKSLIASLPKTIPFSKSLSFSIFELSIKYALIIFISFYVVSGVIYFIHSKKFKTKIDYKKIVVMFGMSQNNLTIGLILSIMCLYINLLVALAVLMIFVSMFIIQAYQGITIISKVDENKTLYISMISLTIMSIAYYIVINGLIVSNPIYKTIIYYITKMLVG